MRRFLLLCILPSIIALHAADAPTEFKQQMKQQSEEQTSKLEEEALERKRLKYPTTHVAQHTTTFKFRIMENNKNLREGEKYSFGCDDSPVETIKKLCHIADDAPKKPKIMHDNDDDGYTSFD